MAYTVSDWIEIPYTIGLCHRDKKSIFAHLISLPLSPLNVEQGASYTFGIGWRSSNMLFQVQWRWMRRLNPAQAILIDTSGGEVWYGWDGSDLSSGSQGALGEWGEWQGNDLTSEVASPCNPYILSGTILYGYTESMFSTTALEIAVPYDTSTYDMARLQVRVRVFQSGGTVSEWGVSETDVVFAPVINGITAELQPDGSLTITADTNLDRGGNIISADGFVVNGQLQGGTAFSASSGKDPSANVTAWPVGSSEVTIQGLTIATANGASVYVPSVTVQVTDPSPSVPLPEPSIGIDEDGTLTIGTDVSPVIDLTGTTWHINEMPTISGVDGWSIGFMSNGEPYDGLFTNEGEFSGIAYRQSGRYNFVYMEQRTPRWKSAAYRTIAITGGTDATDADLIEWFKANAVLVSGSADDYDSVQARASYVDEEGNVYDEVVPLTHGDHTWTGTIPTPPLDVPVAVTVVYAIGDDWDYTNREVVVPSDGRVLLDWGDSHFAVKYNPDRQLTVALLNDAVTVAGAVLPRSRYSTSRTSNMTMTGTLINPAEDAYSGDGWLSQLEILNEPHDWIFRTPNGLRRRVMVSDYTPAWATQSANRVMQVTINMQEVQG